MDIEFLVGPYNFIIGRQLGCISSVFSVYVFGLQQSLSRAKDHNLIAYIQNFREYKKLNVRLLTGTSD